MSKESQALLAAAVALPEEERATLAIQLLDSIRQAGTVSDEQLQESLDRMKSLRSVSLATVSAEDALRLIEG